MVLFPASIKQAVLALLLLASSELYALDLLDRIVAVVGKDVIMLNELRREAQELHAQLVQSQVNPMPGRDRILSQALDQLILHKLQLAEAKRLGVQVEQEIVTRAVMSIAQNNNLSLLRFRDVLAEEGVSYEQFENHIKETLMIRRLINQEVTNRVQISKAEVDLELAKQDKKQSHDSIRLLHILLRTPEAADAEQIKQARNTALRARVRIDNGDPFPVVAQEMSDSQDGIKGGDLGWMPIRQLPLAFNENLRGAQVDEVVGPFRSNRGYHVVKVLGYRNQQQAASAGLIQQTLVRHILIRTDELVSNEDAEERLRQLRERILNDEDFAALARAHSSDQASAIKGGDLGWVSPDDLTPLFLRQMENTPIDAVSEPFKTRFGWHILQVLDRRDYDQSEELRRAAARKVVQERKANEAKQQYLHKLRSEAYIEIRAES